MAVKKGVKRSKKTEIKAVIFDVAGVLVGGKVILNDNIKSIVRPNVLRTIPIPPIQEIPVTPTDEDVPDGKQILVSLQFDMECNSCRKQNMIKWMLLLTCAIFKYDY